MSETACLALVLDGPLQAWGFASRFQRRTTGLHPTKSGAIGMICAALGLAKGSGAEKTLLPQLAALRMTSIDLSRNPVRRLEDFHTTGGGYDKQTQPLSIPRKASGGPCDNPTVSRRQYLVDARFGVLLQGDRALLETAAAALADPRWGVWLGRKSCIPASPICRGVFATEAEALVALIGSATLDSFTTVSDVDRFNDGTDSLNDQPVSFGDGASSGPDLRRFATRRIKLSPALTRSGKPDE